MDPVLQYVSPSITHSAVVWNVILALGFIISNVPRMHALISSSYVIQNVHIHCISYILIKIIEIK